MNRARAHYRCQISIRNVVLDNKAHNDKRRPRRAAVAHAVQERAIAAPRAHQRKNAHALPCRHVARNRQARVRGDGARFDAHAGPLHHPERRRAAQAGHHHRLRPAVRGPGRRLDRARGSPREQGLFRRRGGIFHDGYQRTSTAEIAQFIKDQRLALARLVRPSPSPSAGAGVGTGAGDVVGCVYVKTLSPTLGDFGMLALDVTYRGGGLGRDLVRFAEDHCRRIGCTKMQLELLVPTTFEHALKTRMQAWYLRMGYRIVKLGSFQDEYPALAPLLTGPADYKIFEKDLTSSTP
ncbi:hypothetical protein ACCO45_014006 [Purpureocillium lilacinum]|uniref:Uncharacterized protein n=1 Tax=Purpureocillium lilacinum TaxID=33203 RepID=A0ACC4D9I7_PURLI